MTRRTYLDWNAGAPLRPDARAAMVEALACVGNPSSVHAEGRRARQRVEAARAEVAGLVGADPDAVTFTSGGSEANTTVLAPVVTVKGQPTAVARLLVTAIEHPSVLAGGRFAPEAVEQVAVRPDGVVDLDDLARRTAEAARRGERILVSLMLANNETGVIQPVAEAAAMVRAAGGFLHTDAIQAVGRIPVDVAALGADFLTLSAHKIGGPQGAGAIVAAADLGFARLVTGGGQERRQRAGTENVAAIAGFGAAAAATRRDLATAPRWAGWRDGLVAAMRRVVPGLRVHGEGAPRLPQTLLAGVDGVAAETLVIALDLAGVAVSAGAACSSGRVTTSHVLTAMGVPAERSREAIRVSFGWETAENDLHTFQSAWQNAIGRMSGGGVTRAA